MVYKKATQLEMDPTVFFELNQQEPIRNLSKRRPYNPNYQWIFMKIVMVFGIYGGTTYLSPSCGTDWDAEPPARFMRFMRPRGIGSVLAPFTNSF